MKRPSPRFIRFALAVLTAGSTVVATAPPVARAQTTGSERALSAREQSGPSITAEMAVAIEGATGEIIWERSSHTRVAMASVTKIMTAILAIERGQLSARVVSDVDGPRMAAENGSSIMGLVPGDWLTLEGMLYGLMLVSGNEVAIAIARHLAGTEDGFARLMNEKARALGLRDTQFQNSHGLDAPGHYSSAYDMALLGRYAMQNPTFARIVGTNQITVNGSRSFALVNQNRLLREYAGADGIKIGYTEDAGQSIVASAVRNGHRIYVALMRSTQRTEDSIRIFDFAFASPTAAPRASASSPAPAPAPAPAAAPATGQNALDWDVPSGHFFTQTNSQTPGAARAGFPVTDDASARFWTEFRRMGGVAALGYPISNRFTWDGFLCQAFQRGVLQWRPEISQAYVVNVFDRMHDLGLDGWLQTRYQTPAPLDWIEDRGRTWEQVYRAHMDLLDPFPAFKAKYQETPADPLVVHGLPMAPARDMGNVLVLRMQRSVFQYWKEAVPWARAGEVTVALGGDIAKEAGLLPAAALTPTESTAVPARSGTAPSSAPPGPTGDAPTLVDVMPGRFSNRSPLPH